MKRTFAAWLVVAACTVAIAGAQMLGIKAARRAEKYVDPSTHREVTAPNATDVVLVVELSGLSVEAFEATPKEEIYVAVAARRFDPALTVSRDWFMVDGDQRPVGGVQEDRRVVVVVPRDAVEFSLQFGKLTIPFTAESDILTLLP